RRESLAVTKVLAVAKPVFRWGIVPAVLIWGMRSEPYPSLMDVLYPI
ncbi:unnamed protein product, partial [Ascophyllum nodosum]